jgi:FAD/FMN-containing dehydrogenase
MTMTTTVGQPTATAAETSTDALTRAMSSAVSRVHLPGSPEYAELTFTHNTLVQPSPALVVEATSADEVARAVRVARAHSARVGVQSTGHGTIDEAAGAVLVSTRALDELVVNPYTRTARIGAGVRWQAVLDAAAPYGLAAVCGSSPSVGVVGFLTGGGHGPLVRTYGLSSDRVIAFELVTGDGALRRASQTENPDLYWGLAGGKGMLGIVTAVELELVEQSEIYGGGLWFDEVDVPVILRTWAVWSELLPDEGTTSAAIMRLPEMEGVPPMLAGRTTLHVRFAWTGDPAVGEEMIRALRAMATPLVDAVGVIPYTRIGEVHMDGEDAMPMHVENVLLDRVGAAGAELLLGLVGPGTPTMQALVEVRRIGGAALHALRGPCSFAHRDAEWSVFMGGIAIPEIADGVVADARRIVDGLAPIAREGALPNFAMGTDGWVERSYPADVARRLRELSERYDPAGVLLGGQVLRNL